MSSEIVLVHTNTTFYEFYQRNERVKIFSDRKIFIDFLHQIWKRAAFPS